MVHELPRGRQQRVLYRDSFSQYRKVEFKVPQGSVLGHTLFLCLVMDLPVAIQSTSTSSSITSICADNTIAWCTGSSLVSVKRGLDRISAEYMSAHHLVLNRGQTQVLIVGPSRGSKSSNNDSSIAIDGVRVAPGSNVDVLGVRFDGRPTPHPSPGSYTQGAAKSISYAAMRLSLHLHKGTPAAGFWYPHSGKIRIWMRSIRAATTGNRSCAHRPPTHTDCHQRLRQDHPRPEQESPRARGGPAKGIRLPVLQQASHKDHCAGDLESHQVQDWPKQWPVPCGRTPVLRRRRVGRQSTSGNDSNSGNISPGSRDAISSIKSHSPSLLQKL